MMVRAPRKAARIGRDPSALRGGASSLLIGLRTVSGSPCRGETEQPTHGVPWPTFRPGPSRSCSPTSRAATRLLELLGAGCRPSSSGITCCSARRSPPAQGIEIGTEGDSFFVVFARPGGGGRRYRRAARRSRPSRGRRTPRSGCGWVSTPARALLGGDSYVGLDVHRAARIASRRPRRTGPALGDHPGRWSIGSLPAGVLAASTWASIGSRTSPAPSTCGSW